MLRTQLAEYAAAMAGSASPPGVLILADETAPLRQSTVKQLQARVGYVTVVGVGMYEGTFYSLFVSDEGLLRGDAHNGRATLLARQPIVGDVLLVGDPEPESADEKYLDLKPADAQRLIERQEKAYRLADFIDPNEFSDEDETPPTTAVVWDEALKVEKELGLEA